MQYAVCLVSIYAHNNPCEVSGYELFYAYRIKESPLIRNAKYGLDPGKLNTALSSKHDERIIISL